jgi:hypothetical protein
VTVTIDRDARMPSPVPTEGRNFESEAARALQGLRTALAGIVASVPGGAAKPVEMQRALNIDMKLSCKVFKVIGAAGPLAAGPHVPGISALRTFLHAASAVGVQEPLVNAAVLAAAEFDRVVATHAGDRATFDSMISSLANIGDATRITLEHRRAAFRAQRHIFGLQAKALLKCMVVQPSADPRLLDFVQISGFLLLRQLRPDAPLVISRVRTTNDDGTVREIGREPLDPTPDQTFGNALLREFCSQPPPQYRAVQTAPGMVCGELISNGVGKKGAITCLEGHVARAAVPRYRDAGNSVGANNARIRVPCEALILDLLVHEEAFGALRPIGFTCAENLGEVPAPSTCAEWQRLDPRESVAYLGKGPSVLYAADFSRYADLGRYIFDRLGWDGTRFDVYRCHVEYPVLPSTVVMQFDLPAAPDA